MKASEKWVERTMLTEIIGQIDAQIRTLVEQRAAVCQEITALGFQPPLRTI
ncbi:Uncharacterised protein [Mycobacteroides abscessus subsp. abscessus]|uniref:Chorismate mutase n=1 Tax=Mycobacteroides abscessus subsp. abscessus TaxID=1185650 RepID=A0AB38D0Z0_9MYCO|nr:Uncharacterised protein [Mycobacteroides abscessus subsp. abscessus]SHY19404.1 Uncharacterised protein [Mycobacteroides abscessus subsp. abscessus]SIA08249.1 Uncharacterised protein [Mycobacteroides abscessus subsp. abscessus]SIA16467.1 Uncharacterised protein [Mycobacteroides abscessus subsp. abscessus]SIB10806.1 Uncharacterised protein [Mycobacteroides abscessus subsp. abscessus]